MVKKLIHRYTLAFGMVIIIVVIVMAAVFFLQSSSVFSRINSSSAAVMGSALHAEADKRLRTLGMILSEDLVNPLYEYDMLAMFQLLQSVSQLDDVEYVIVVDSKGTIIHDGTELLSRYGESIDDTSVLSWLENETRTLVHQKKHTLELASPIRIADEVTGWVIIGLSLQPQFRNIKRMADDQSQVITDFEKHTGKIVIIVALFLLLVGLVLALLISGRFAQPIKELSEFVFKVGQGEYGVQMNRQREDELGHLIDAFNRMSLDLSKSSVSRQYLEDILNNMHDALTVVSEQGEVLLVNASAEYMLQRTETELIGKPYMELISRKEKNRVEAWLYQVIKQGAEPIDTSYQLVNGEQLPVILSAAFLLKNEGVNQLICVAQDISERKRNEAHIRYLAEYDSLTNLPNRQLLRDRLKHAMEQAIRGEYLIAVMFIDLDRFKKINDSIGHQVGDRLLKETAARLKKLLRLGDTVARMGGDEFVVVTEQINTVVSAYHVAELIIETLREPFEIAGRKLYIGCSIGITYYPFGDDTLDNLIQQSDMAMYHAKQSGRGHYEIYHHKLGLQQDGSMRMEHELAQAIRNNGFHMNYQPLISVNTNHFLGFEALLRWDHPRNGVIGPVEFLPILENSGMIIELGDWVLETACYETLACQKLTDQTICLNVNVSMHQFNQLDFPCRVTSILSKTGFNPRLLKLEITESSLVDDIELSRSTIKKLKKLGIMIAVDDFGTGYSAFTYLRDFDLDCLKLDHSFIKDLPSDRYAEGICRALITMAKEMDLDIVAEGVENELQLEWLKKEGVDEYQGRFCSPPMNLEQTKSFIKVGNYLSVNSSGA
jgi:diguanylate cyclase (GGDEF)-like protein/PAS domain S-box-containing protein